MQSLREQKERVLSLPLARDLNVCAIGNQDPTAAGDWRLEVTCGQGRQRAMLDSFLAPRHKEPTVAFGSPPAPHMSLIWLSLRPRGIGRGTQTTEFGKTLHPSPRARPRYSIELFF